MWTYVGGAGWVDGAALRHAADRRRRTARCTHPRDLLTALADLLDGTESTDWPTD
jgi:hypothetical protein